MAPRKSAARGDKAKPTTKEEVKTPPAAEPTTSSTEAPADQAAAAATAAAEAPEAPENYWWVTFRQHIGFILGALSIFLTYWLWEEGDPMAVWKMVGCLGLCCVGLVFHELRPFKAAKSG